MSDSENRIRQQIEQCERELADVYHPEGVAIWMRSGHLSFGMHSAEQMIRMGRGDEVLAEIDRLRTGAFG